MSKRKKAAEPVVGVAVKSPWRKVLFDGAISDGRGGYYPAGELIQAAPETIESLLEKGLIG